MKKVVNKISMLVILIGIIFCSSNVFASDLNVDDIFSGEVKDTKGNSSISTVDPNAVTGLEEAQGVVESLIGNIIATMFILGTGIAIIVFIVFGIKYIVGSIEEKAEIKKHLTAYVVGVVVFYSAASILYLFQEFVYGNLNN